MLWYENELKVANQPLDVILSVRGHYDQSRVSINIEIERLTSNEVCVITLFSKAAEAGRHVKDSLRASYLFRLQKLLDKTPKTWDLFRPWAVQLNPSLEIFLSSIP